MLYFPVVFVPPPVVDDTECPTSFSVSSAVDDPSTNYSFTECRYQASYQRD